MTILCEHPDCDEELSDDDMIIIEGSFYCISHGRQLTEFCRACGEHEEEHPTAKCQDFVQNGGDE